jgi:DNA-binding XRE family transcriptional regulator
MNKIPYPTINESGKPTHVVLPLDDYLALVDDVTENYPPYDPAIIEQGSTPAKVAFAALDGLNPLKAWRKHLSLTQEHVAEKMGVSRPAYTQMEKSGRPHQKTLERAAKVFGTSAGALAELYND